MTAPAATSPAPDQRERLLHLIQGEFAVSAMPQVILTTTLGSCVATCMRDPVALIGGMNHFLLPYGEHVAGPGAQRYGAYAMELLINGLLRAGGRRARLEAKLFGGGRLSEGLPDIGGRNVAFAEQFLENEGISVQAGSVRGRHARRVQFWPVTGRIRQLFLPESDVVFDTERRKPQAAADTGAVDLFDL